MAADDQNGGRASAGNDERVRTALDAIAAAAAAEHGSSARGFDARDFVRRYYEQSDLDGLDIDPALLARAALGHRQWARHRPPGKAKLRVFNPTAERDGWTSAHTIVETVYNDMPFLVDSLTMALNALGHAIHETVHPVLRVTRNAAGELLDAGSNGGDSPESWIHFEIVRETEPTVLAAIEHRLAQVLDDVRDAVNDWPAMLERLRAAAAELCADGASAGELATEASALLDWLARDHFTLLGYREYELTPRVQFDELRSRAGTGLGLLRAEPAGDETVRLAGRARDEARSSNPLVITKSNVRSTVHRPALLDHIGVKVFGRDGRPLLERRFLGLFTSVAYNQSPHAIPLLRMKIRHIMDESGLDRRSHRGKALQHIIDTLPRDELFQASIPELRAVAYGILGLGERHKTKVFCRREPFGRYYSCLVYLPRDQYNPRARSAVEILLRDALHGSSVESEVAISESALARLAVTVRTPPGRPIEPDLAGLQHAVEEAVRTWQDRLRTALLAELPEDAALSLLRRFGDRVSAAYQEDIDTARAAQDLRRVARLADGSDDLDLSLARAERPERLRLTAYKRSTPIPLYVALPALENFGFRVLAERIYTVRAEKGDVAIQDFELETTTGQTVDPAASEARFVTAFALVLRNAVDNDSFNSFVVSAGLDWREAALLRSFCRYLLQTGARYSQAYMQAVLARYPAYCSALLRKFAATFDVDLAEPERAARLAASEIVLQSELDRTASLDDDRILRAYGAVVHAMLRTNFYQRDAGGGVKSYISFKLDPALLPDLPKPRPKFEIFVYSQRVEGVHLRSSRVARGGIRWSDRPEDFRTEVLGLMKAQQVKNTVIVPNGAKGGFVCKALPAGDRDAVQREVAACYQTFIRGLLDLTDNVVDGRVVPPARVLRKDDDDPYLVVAADKGTAQLSDTANALSADYGFWLGDAFASGGSAGYDHKKMGITARGAWEAVKRHFRECGIDARAQDFTVLGIGDMSGDVFGNGLLLSPRMKLVAAFDHRHIFVDPNPDPAKSFAERKRLFELPRSSWDDYDRTLLSAGGGVYSRQTKAIDLHPAARAALGVATDKVTPPELIRALLTARADLLWNGGIGTYVKAAGESHADAGDPANDAVRVNGAELRCRVVAEGGNLGFTQRGRIEYAEHGGRINADFIDNSAGVDSSDREVNIKILLEDAIRRKKLARKDRNALLASMTEEIANHVLANNYAQTQALSMMQSRAAERVGEHARLIRMLETQGLLDRALEFLPADDQIEERRAQQRGLTRPELAIILSYSKIELHASLVQTDIHEDPFLAAELASYFPREITQRFRPLIREHRLARQIIAMLIGGSMINRMGPFFVLRAEEETGASVAQVARAYAIVREVFGVRKLWREIEALDYTVEPKLQYDAIFEISRMVRRAVYWLLQNYAHQLDVEAVVMRFRPGVAAALEALPTMLDGRAGQRFATELRQLAASGLPDATARQIAGLGFMTQMLDIIELAREFGRPIPDVGRLYFGLGKELRLDVVREQIEALHVEGRWRAVARATLRENLAQEQRALLRSVLRSHAHGEGDGGAAWLRKNAEAVARVQRALDEMQSGGPPDFATLSVALKEVSRLA